MAKLRDEHFEKHINLFAKRDPELFDELRDKLLKRKRVEEEPMVKALVLLPEEPLVDSAGRVTPPGDRVAETIVRRSARPVMVIRNNRVTSDFVGPDSQVWATRVMDAQKILDVIIPSVGRVEVDNNPDYSWVGTGWMVAEDIIVTNRHVAREFARLGPGGFVFRSGLNACPQIPRVDFLEEYGSAQSLEFKIDSVLWIATPSDPDVAFLRVRKSTFGPSLPPPIPLAENVAEDEAVVTIGYPARDSRVPDQALVQKVFGDVYEKKRLAPGQVVSVEKIDLGHDCSTLGGNSGSPVISLRTGKAVGLHYSGVFLQQNYAVLAPRVGELLAKVIKSEMPGMRVGAYTLKPADPAMPGPGAMVASSAGGGAYTVNFNLPVEITVRIGGAAMPLTLTPAGGGGGAAPPGRGGEDRLATALFLAREAVGRRRDVVDVRLGYRFKRGWITDERVVVVEVRKKMGKSELRESNVEPIPENFAGIGVDVRTAPLQDQLESQGLSLEGLELLPRPGAYREPPDLQLKPVTVERARFCVSPDSGFTSLRDFLARVEKSLTATMYEWDAKNHVSDAIVAAMDGPGKTLTMVTQQKGTRDAIDDLQDRIGEKLRHVWASVGKDRLIPTAYHIKVASRDGKEAWLSSGNWKESNQPQIDPAGDHSTIIAPLRNYNREWHAIIENDELATMFQKYIEWDFAEAQRVPLEEAPEVELPDLFVPEPAFAEPEARGKGVYFAPLDISEEFEVQPLLTPDQTEKGKRIFITTAIEMLRRASRSICIENQSFNLLKENVDEFEEFFTVLRDRQQSGVDVRIIFRDPREFGQGGVAALDKLLETIKDFGLDTDRIKVQKRCHTKGIIVDEREILFGSHNLTNSGALYNRDASLLVKNEKVAKYFLQIFEYDWKTVAVQEAEELIGGIELAHKGVPTPPGYRRVSAAEVLGLT